MKKVFFWIVSAMLITMPLQAENIGVPAECEGVMLQAFYWDSYKNQTGSDSKYGRTKWIDLLKDTSAINANFDLVWFPPSASSTGGVGYYHACLSNQDGAWGSKAKLNELIEALHKGNTKVIADIVINHRGNKSSWTDFYQDNFGSYGSFQLTQSHICSGDEAFTDSKSSAYKSSTHGAADTGTNDGGCRDLDHTSEYVQNWAKAYVKWMINVMKYDGFRYDMTLGYHGRYLSMYNEASNPYLSVSELWESIDRQVRHLQETNYNTMIFDFPLKYVLNNALGKYTNYGLLKNPSNSLRNKGYKRYAVTFIDNHDTFERDSYGSNQFAGQFCDLSDATIKRRVMEANAYILMLPGVPCIFYPHWKSYQSDMNALIAVRKMAGLHSESAITEVTENNVYEATVTGHHGTIILRMGPNRSKEVPEGYRLALEGGSMAEYTIFFSENTQGMEEVKANGEWTKGEKFIENGQLYIRCGEKVYNALGQIIKN
ncbi:MAG: alpha-amylase [Paludibacteraceae bacterium]|nr:alpha-amylase [Paludibacteraceae bacterium]